MPSLDIVSEVDPHEYENAMNQASKEINTRYDFKGTKCAVKWDKESFTITGDTEEKLKVVREVVYFKLGKREISLNNLDLGSIESGTGMSVRQKVTLKMGLNADDSKRIIKVVKDAKMKKIQAQRQGDQVRLTGPKIDDLRSLMDHVKSELPDLSLQFDNFKR